jgi:hypothetical protein
VWPQEDEPDQMPRRLWAFAEVDVVFVSGEQLRELGRALYRWRFFAEAIPPADPHRELADSARGQSVHQLTADDLFIDRPEHTEILTEQFLHAERTPALIGEALQKRRRRQNREGAVGKVFGKLIQGELSREAALEMTAQPSLDRDVELARGEVGSPSGWREQARGAVQALVTRASDLGVQEPDAWRYVRVPGRVCDAQLCGPRVPGRA